jgi:ATP-dependent exoDNAse (exonuclease V) beta subunit
VEARARGYGITDPRQLTGAVGESRRLLRRFRQHHLYQTMACAERRLHEVPYSLIVGGQVERGIIDAMYLSAGRWTIVEFKTDDVRDEVQFKRLLDEEDYVTQARRYAAAVEELLGQRPRLMLCMLNYAGSVRLHPIE